MSQSTRPTTAVKRAEQIADIMQMRTAGFSFAHMARKYGCSETYVRKLFDRGISKIVKADVDKVRVQESERLDDLHEKAMALFEKEYLMVSSGKIVSYTQEVEGEDGDLDVEKVMLKDVAPKLQAMDRILKIMERRAKLLGLDMPTKIAPTDPSGEESFEIILTPQDESL